MPLRPLNNMGTSKPTFTLRQNCQLVSLKGGDEKLRSALRDRFYRHSMSQ